MKEVSLFMNQLGQLGKKIESENNHALHTDGNYAALHFHW
jgi:hypothetical protein